MLHPHSFSAYTVRTFALALTALTPLYATAQSHLPTEHALAMAHYDDCRWHDAYAQLGRLAQAGHVESGRVALLMTRHGRRLYGVDFASTPLERQAWAESAAKARAASSVGEQVAER